MGVPSMQLLAAKAATTASFTPADLSGLKAWYDASDTATITDAGAGKVSQWNDKSSSGYNLAQGTDANRPLTGSSTQNGLNTITFDGSNDSLLAASAADWVFLHDGVLPTAFYVVYKRTAGGDTFLAGTNRYAGGQIGFGASLLSSGVNMWSYVSTTSGTVVISNSRAAFTGRATDCNLAGYINDPANATASLRSTLRANGAAVTGTNTATGTPTGSNPYGPLRVGADGIGDVRLTGNICEIVCWTSPDSVEWEALETYLIDKWGIT